MKKKHLQAMRDAAELLLRDAAWHLVQGDEGRALAKEYVDVAFLLAEAAEVEKAGATG
jgi:hypothetical protein